MLAFVPTRNAATLWPYITTANRIESPEDAHYHDNCLSPLGQSRFSGFQWQIGHLRCRLITGADLINHLTMLVVTSTKPDLQDMSRQIRILQTNGLPLIYPFTDSLCCYFKTFFGPIYDLIYSCTLFVITVCTKSCKLQNSGRVWITSVCIFIFKFIQECFLTLFPRQIIAHTCISIKTIVKVNWWCHGS